MSNLPSSSPGKKQANKPNKCAEFLGALAIFSWGLLLIKYAVTGQYQLLIHPNYFYLMLVTGLVLLIIGLIKISRLPKSNSTAGVEEQHLTIFPPGIGSTLLLIAAIAGLLIPPNVLTSKTALQRGVTETLPSTRSQPQAFVNQTRPEDRTLIDWVRTLNAYPEPDAYSGQKAQLEGFVIRIPELPANYLLLSRFILNCCAVDAYPVFIPVELPPDASDYPADTWLQVSGKMITKNLAINVVQDRNIIRNSPNTNSPQARAKRRLVLKAEQTQKIPTPRNPYRYQ